MSDIEESLKRITSHNGVMGVAVLDDAGKLARYVLWRQPRVHRAPARLRRPVCVCCAVSSVAPLSRAQPETLSALCLPAFCIPVLWLLLRDVETSSSRARFMVRARLALARGRRSACHGARSACLSDHLAPLPDIACRRKWPRSTASRSSCSSK